MNSELEKIYQGIIIDEEDDINLVQLCNYCELQQETVIDMVNEGIVEPLGQSKVEWRFSFTTVERLKRIKRLQRDFDLTLPGVGLAMDLLDRIEKLERMLQYYENPSKK
jgi:chaperone modulatory protein CbpM